MKEIGCDRGKAVSGEAVHDLFDMRHETPVLLNDDDARTFAGEIALTRLAVRKKLNAFAHRILQKKSRGF